MATMKFSVSGGGKTLLNGQPIKLVSVGDVVIRTDSTSPAELYGGTWTCLAENVTMPLGDSATVYGLAHYMQFYTDATSLDDSSKKNGPFHFCAEGLSGNTFFDLYLYGGDATGTQGKNGMCCATKKQLADCGEAPFLEADLTSATNAISGIYVWKCVEI